jgi:hypothetical protein
VTDIPQPPQSGAHLPTDTLEFAVMIRFHQENPGDRAKTKAVMAQCAARLEEQRGGSIR